ncbi:MAG: adenylate/guanylate cyclase domain-containing protein, partial [Acidimicrobiia bacterium]
FGSIIAYTAYIYLLRTVRPALATSYAYANPLVAVLLGVTLGGEILTGPVFLALPLILLGVAIVALAPNPAPKPVQKAAPATPTFLITDVEASTRLWEDHPEAMHWAMARHDEILHRALGENCGRIFSVAGDSFAAAFDRADEALSAAVKTQTLLASEDWGPAEIRVRIGIHSGDAKERDGRYYGQAVNRAARLADVAHGGQSVLSCCTRELLLRVPEGTDVIDLGKHRLRDLQHPERIYQLTSTGLETEFPPLRSIPRPAVA